MSYKIDIADSVSYKLEISSSVNDQNPIIDTLSNEITDINISHNIALLPSDFSDNVKTIIDNFLTSGYGVSIVPSGSFLIIATSGLQPSGNYSLVGHSHVSSDITNFNSSVSGLLPVKNIVSGSGINISDLNGTFTVAVTGQFGLTAEQVDDRVSGLLSSGYGINLSYDDNNNLLTISTIGLQPSGDYSIIGHTHLSSNITDFTSAASGAAPVQSVAGRLGNIVLIKNDVGLNNVDNTSDLNKPVSLAQAAADLVIQNNAASDASTKANNAQSYSIQRSNHTGTQTASTISDFIAVASGAAPVQSVAGRVGNVVLNKNDIGLNNVDNTSDINKPVSSATQNALNLKSDIGHLHTSSNITDFSSSVSGLLPVKNILSGSGISVTSLGSDFTVAVTGQFGLTGEQVDDRVSNLLVAGNYVSLNYNDSNDSLAISVTGLQPSGNYSIAGHSHIISDVSGLQNSLDSKQPVGSYANSIHSHTVNDITDFNSSVSGLLTPYATVNSPNFSGVPTAPTASSGTNNSQIANTQFVRTEISSLVNSAPSTLDTLNELATALGNDPNFATTITNNLANKANLNGANFSGAVSGPSGDFGVLKQSGVVVSVSGHSHLYTDISNFASGVSDNLTTTLLPGSFINLDYNSTLDTLTISTSGLQPSGNYSVVGHTHASSNISDFNSSVSGLLPTVANSGANRVLISTGSNVGVSAQANLTFNGSLLNITGSGVFSSGLNIANQTASTIASFDNNKNIISLPTGTYPSLNELTYVKGVTSSLQTQLDNKAALSHTHSSSQITDFNSSVSGLLPVKNVSGTGYVNVSSVSGDYTVSVSGLQPSGSYSLTGHTHISSDITNFNSSVSGLLPSVSGSEYVSSNFANNIYTISVSGLQPSGNYSSVGHTHTSSNITDFNSSVSGLLPTIANSGDNRILTSTGSNVGINAENNLTFDGSLLNVSGSGSFSNNVTASGFVRSGGTSSQFLKADGSIDSSSYYLNSNPSGYTTNIGTVTSVAALTVGSSGTDISSSIENSTSTPVITLNIPSASASNRGLLTSSDWTTFNNKQPSGNYSTVGHTHSSSDITNFNSSVSGLLPVTNILGGSNITVSQSGTIYTVAVTGSLGLTTEEVDDRVASLLVAGSGINLNYNDPANSLTISVSGLSSSATIGNGSSGVINYDLSQALNIVGSGSTSINYNNTSKTVTISSPSLIREYELINTNKSVFTVTGGYAINNLDVYHNGIKLLVSGDYTATNGSTFSLVQPAVSGDVVEWLGYSVVPRSQLILGEVRSDTVGSINYLGRAVAGSSENNNVWTIKRYTIAANGSDITTATASNVSWNNRLTASYV